MKQLFAFALLLLSFETFAQQKGYYRSPAIFKNTIVFTAEGDLWKYDLTNGLTLRLTTHAGVETNPIFSPDGKQIVFTGQYEGATELYIMDVDGGVPKRLTYDFDARTKPVQWTADGQIMYTTGKYNLLPDPQLAKLNPKTLAVELVPLAQASDGYFDSDKTLYFNRLPKQGSFNKRYRGGYIQQIWKFDGTQEAKCLTCDFDGTSARPIVYRDRIYFASDRDGTMNLWSTDKEGKSIIQHTTTPAWDIRSFAMYESKIVFQRGADLYLYDVDSKTEKLLDINLVSDFDQRKPRWFKTPAENITHYGLSPEGNFVAIVSRGRLFTAPAKGGRWVEVNRMSGIRYKDVQFLDERTLVYQCDASGEFEIWKTKSDGTGTPQQLTKNSSVLIWTFLSSPDGKWIAYRDKDENFRVIDSNSGAVKFSVKDAEFGINDWSWSNDSKYITYSHGIENQVSQVSAIELATGKITPLTTPRLESYSTTWTKDNQWIYFLSERSLQTKVRSPWGQRQPEPYFTEVTGVYAMPLSGGLPFPFIQKDPWSDKKVTPEVDLKAKDDKKKPSEIPAAIPDWNFASNHLFTAPIKNANIGNLRVADEHLYWMDYGSNQNGKAKLFALKMEFQTKPEPVEIAADIEDFDISANRKKILIKKSQGSDRLLYVADANGSKVDLDKSKVELSNWNFQIDPQEDWKQMFADAWRMERDYFYDHNMHGVDWVAVRKQHEPLLERITDRYELDDILSHMVSELAALHTFVRDGDKRKSPDFIQAGFLGANLTAAANGAKIDHIYKNDPDFPQSTSPLDKPELSVNEGDVITSVNDVPVNSVRHISELLANKVGVSVKLSLLNKNGAEYTQMVSPISADAESSLRYSEWELTRRKSVDNMSNSAIGYVHLRAMTSSDLDDFVKQFYPVYSRHGLVIDVRHNRGGNIDSWVLEKLMRKAWFYWKGRAGKPYWNMQYAFRGHMVVLCDQFTASDGEAFAEGFRRLGLGKVVGMRTWGGEIWLSSSNRMVDGGVASAAENGVFGPEGKWLIEGHGVDPDFVVDNLPGETFKGKDAQLEFAVKYLQEKIAKEPVTAPVVPAYPDKSFKYKKTE